MRRSATRAGPGTGAMDWSQVAAIAPSAKGIFPVSHGPMQILVAAAAGLMETSQLAGGAGAALYPDLIAKPPSDLRFDPPQ